MGVRLTLKILHFIEDQFKSSLNSTQKTKLSLRVQYQLFKAKKYYKNGVIISKLTQEIQS